MVIPAKLTTVNRLNMKRRERVWLLVCLLVSCGMQVVRLGVDEHSQNPAGYHSTPLTGGTQFSEIRRNCALTYPDSDCKHWGGDVSQDPWSVWIRAKARGNHHHGGETERSTSAEV